MVPSSASTPLQSDKDKKESSVPTIRIVPHVGDHRGSCPFAIQERKVPNGEVIKVKRFVDKAPPEQSALSFRSKVVSRQHAEIWSEGSNFYIKDTKSSSGTFVNNVRISPAGLESKPVMLRDGDIVQLGVDYQGRTEDVFKCVRMRVELNRSPLSRTNNEFRRQVVKALKSLALASNSTSGDCCICLSKISPFQALFIAPCCHSFHYKCARPLLNSFPNFLCPLCRNFADLGASVSMESLSLLDAEDLDESDLNPDLDDAENKNRGTVIASNGAEHENEQRSTEIMELDSEEFGASQEGIGGGTQVEEVNSGSYESQNGRRPFVGSNFNSPRNQTMFPGQYPDETL